ncbi:MAG TPA: Crp/Fnr family transcriptional regulator, partial [Polyangiaceae bacterium]|nr:Crp/Fnr family transcriptional regulator [Polyangiaceae bacterium]
IKRVGAIERGLRVLRPGDLFGEAALVPGAPRNSTAVALDDGAALVLDPATFQQVLTANPNVGGRVLQQVIRRLRDAEDQIEILMLRDTQSKIVVALLKLAQQSLGSSGRSEGAASLSVSPMDLSTRVGLDVETVKRNVQDLRDGGYVRIVEERVEITDLAALRELFGLIGLKEQIVGGEGPGDGKTSRRPARR